MAHVAKKSDEFGTDPIQNGRQSFLCRTTNMGGPPQYLKKKMHFWHKNGANYCKNM